jgi:hypothetical protein
MKNQIRLFNSQKIRSVWDENIEDWYFSIVDVVRVLTDSINAGAYWRKLKQRMMAEGNEFVTNCHELKMPATDGKYYKTDVATTKQLLRLIQSIPSKKAEPFKIWLASVGNDRINENQNPELTIERAMKEYRDLGYGEEWISARLQSIQFRKELTDEWRRTGVQEGLEYAILTNLISQGWSSMTVAEYKKLKGLKKENLRDNMSSVELALNILAEVTTTELSKAKNPKDLDENMQIASEGGAIAKNARNDIEKRTGKSVITSQNARQLKKLSERKTTEALDEGQK